MGQTLEEFTALADARFKAAFWKMQGEREAFKLHSAGVPVARIANAYGVSRPTAYKMIEAGRVHAEEDKLPGIGR